MDELDFLIEKYYKKKKDNFGFSELLKLVEGVIGEPAFMVQEGKDSKGKTRTISISMIPDIEVSELGWSDVRTPDGEGAPVKGRERQILEDYLENIAGAGGIEKLSEKLQALSSLADNPKSFIESESSGKSPTQKIKTVISFLVFYKTLTKIIANFNAASAGFSFESFLATLLKGKQIPASGADTIADFIDQDGVKISLKLYNEKSIEVGGSFVDLIGDLIQDEKMTYLVVMKDLKGSRETLDGVLKFYKFDFTLQNVMEILKDSKAFSARCIILPLESEEEVELPARLNAKKMMKEKFEEYLSELIDDQEMVSAILNKPEFIYGTDENKELWTSGVMLPGQKGTAKHSMVIQTLKDGVVSSDDEAYEVAKILRTASAQAAADIKSARAERGEKVSTVIPSFTQYGTAPKEKEKKKEYQQDVKTAADASADFYAGLPDEQKKKALLKTNGYINELQFSLNKAEVIKLASGQAGADPSADPSIGILKIGSKSLQQMLDAAVKALNTDIFSIFANLEDLSDSLNGFFAGGLTDDESAVKAIENADAIESKTEKIRKEK